MNMNKAIANVKYNMHSLFEDQFKADIYNDIRKDGEGNKLRTYRIFKNSIYQEPYLSQVENRQIRQNISRLRMSAHNLKIESGRHSRPKIPLQKRLCEACSDKIDNEFHLLTECISFDSSRQVMFNMISSHVNDFKTLPKDKQFSDIMTLDDESVIQALAYFISSIVKKRGSL